AEPSPRNRDLAPGVADDLHEQSRRRAALVELPRRMQIPRTQPMRHDTSCFTRARDEWPELGFADGVDECLDRDVVGRFGRRKQVVERALRLELRIVARSEDLLRLVPRSEENTSEL